VTSIDVGCMQVNLMYHPSAFASLEQAFDPSSNALYAARFLNRLFAQTNDWEQAAAMYHSATPELGEDYRQRVLAFWPAGAARHEAAVAREKLAAAWAATLGRLRPRPLSSQPGRPGETINGASSARPGDPGLSPPGYGDAVAEAVVRNKATPDGPYFVNR
jgi:hypothetical protein